jgi:hypothetical protein
LSCNNKPKVHVYIGNRVCGCDKVDMNNLDSWITNPNILIVSKKCQILELAKMRGQQSSIYSTQLSMANQIDHRRSKSLVGYDMSSLI